MRKLQITRYVLVALALALTACTGDRGLRRGGAGTNWREQGLASWYGPDFHGRRTANGERYNMYAMTAAHKTLPLGTSVLVTNRENGRRLRVRINDRGPFVAGRIIDLSFAAAKKLGFAEAGVVPVTVEAGLPSSAFAAAPAPSRTARAARDVLPAAPALQGSFAVQVGAFTVEDNARALAARLPLPREAVRVGLFEDNRGRWWRVRVAGYTNEFEAGAAAAALAEHGLPGFIVRED